MKEDLHSSRVYSTPVHLNKDNSNKISKNYITKLCQAKIWFHYQDTVISQNKHSDLH